MPTLDLEDVIQDSISDSLVTPEPIEEAPEEAVEATPTETPTLTPETPVEPVLEAASPIPAPAQDEFEKKFGLTPNTPGGRENRIPYSRVKKITEKAVADARKAWDTETTPKLTQFDTVDKEYKAYKTNVEGFEKIMVSDPDKHFNMLSSIPAYEPIFKEIREAFAAKARLDAGFVPQAAPQAPANPQDDMPQPDQDLSDGTKVYSMDGLKALLSWQQAQTEAKVTKQIEDRYRPIESEWQANQRVAAVIPVVRQQIEEARKWELFSENEEDITKALQSDGRLSLEGAYRKVVFPKLKVERGRLREELLAELKAAPTSTSVVSGSTKAVAPVHTGPRDLESIIAEQIKTIK